jgi:uncharacterized membrane protein
MDLTHVHLILNHVPVVGIVFSGALFAIACRLGSGSFQRVALWFFVVCAVLTIPVYLTGEPAEHRLERAVSASETVIERHEEAAGIVLVAAEALGLLALGGALWFRRRDRVPGVFAALVLALALSTTGLFAWVGFVGGQIRHTEILSPPGTTATPGE